MPDRIVSRAPIEASGCLVARGGWAELGFGEYASIQPRKPAQLVLGVVGAGKPLYNDKGGAMDSIRETSLEVGDALADLETMGWHTADLLCSRMSAAYCSGIPAVWAETATRKIIRQKSEAHALHTPESNKNIDLFFESRRFLFAHAKKPASVQS